MLLPRAVWLPIAHGSSIVGLLLLCSCASNRLPHEIPPPVQGVFEVEGLEESVVLSYEDYASLWEVCRTAGVRSTRYIFFPSGLVQYVKQYHKELADGIYRRWSESGILLESGQFSKGNPTGIWYEYREDGTLKGKGTLGDLAFSKTSERIYILTMEHFTKGPDWETYE